MNYSKIAPVWAEQPMSNFSDMPTGEYQGLGEGFNDMSARLVEVAGAIKWFDQTKGFGFIVPDDGRADVLIHVSVLRHSNFQTAYEGARIVVEAIERQRGLQAFRVISMDETTAIHPSMQPLAKLNTPVVATSGLERAVVKWFNRLRGFGFVTTGINKPDIFVHMEVLRRYGLSELRPGQTILVRYGDGDKGLMAAEVQPDGAPFLQRH